MSANRTLFAGASLGHVAVFACGEGAGGGTADVLDLRRGTVHTAMLQGGGSRCLVAAVHPAVTSLCLRAQELARSVPRQPLLYRGTLRATLRTARF